MTERKTKAETAIQGRDLVTTRVFDAPREVVFSAWSDAGQLAQWCAPEGTSTTTLRFEFRDGGAWKYVMHGLDGVDYPNFCRYSEIVFPERIAYSHSSTENDFDHQIVHTVVTFEAQGGSTLLRMRSRFCSVETLEQVVREFHTIDDATQTLERLALLVARQEVAA